MFLYLNESIHLGYALRTTSLWFQAVFLPFVYSSVSLYKICLQMTVIFQTAIIFPKWMNTYSVPYYN